MKQIIVALDFSTPAKALIPDRARASECDRGRSDATRAASRRPPDRRSLQMASDGPPMGLGWVSDSLGWASDGSWMGLRWAAERLRCCSNGLQWVSERFIGLRRPQICFVDGFELQKVSAAVQIVLVRRRHWQFTL